ncbi:MAG TPA: HAMP domain-containing sensor histidine kinase [Xanthomonadales bacterium]|nr:HAMP domain-containing sensor histidine kinase [Xanthomonadales bacterium]
MFRTGTLRTNLVRVFLLQVLAISLAVVLGVFGAAKVVENILVSEALDGEAEHYWALYQANPAHPRPNTLNLRGYLRHARYGDEVPAWLSAAEPGFRRIDNGESQPLVHISDRTGDWGDARLYLVFDEIQVSRLAMFFGVAPLSLVLLLAYTVAWFGYRLSRNAVSPLVQLAKRVEAFDARSGDLKDLDFQVDTKSNSEVQILAGALQHFIERMNQFLLRERNFTRNASHELRTPLAVMQANLDALQRRAADQPELAVPLERMQRTVRDMEKLLETLLILAREDESQVPREAIIINDLVAERIEQVRRALQNDQVAVHLEADSLVQLQAPPKVLAIVIDNLLRNAISYTEQGEVVVRIRADGLAVSDNGPGMNEELLQRVFEPFARGESTARGFGLGLTIVKRLCDRFGWKITMQSEPGVGSTASLFWGEAEVLGRKKA